MSKTVLLGVNSNQGYSPEQISTSITLADLLNSVQEAIEQFGEDAQVVVFTGQSYGADFGSLQTLGHGDSTVSITDAAPDNCPACGEPIDEAVYGQCDNCGEQL
jgi:hypothetical protein